MKPHRVKRRPKARHGMAVLMVLLLLSLTVGLCYAAMRGQSTVAAIQRNSDRQASARQAAMTGIAVALKKMHAADWQGVGTSLTKSLGDYSSYCVTFTAGDPTLDAGHSDQPYRVTLSVSGYAIDSENPQSIATHCIRAVVRLIPRQLAPQPSDFVAMKGYTLYQTKKEDTNIDIPCRFQGPVRLQKKLKLAVHYPDDNDARTRYLTDLNRMRQAGLGDYRPFNGPVSLPRDEQESKYYTLLTSSLGVTAIDTAAQESNTNWTRPTSTISYRIYPGGPQYAAQTVSDSLQAISLVPDVATNPLGVFFHDGPMTIGENMTIDGSLFCTGDVRLTGTNFVLKPPALPALAGASAAVRLPALCCRNAAIRAGAGGQMTGLLAVFEAFLVEKGSEDMKFSLAGQLAAAKIDLKERTPWNSLNWDMYHDYYLLCYYLNPWSVTKYFPVWMAGYGRSPVPLLTFAPEPSEVVYHWSNSYDPIFVPHTDDGGLRWDVLSWAENP